MASGKLRKFILFVLVLGFTFPVFTQAEDLGTQCEVIAESADGCSSMGAEECKAFLQKCADYYDEQSEQLSQDLTKTSQQKNTLQYQINSFKKKIQGLDAEISKGNIMVKDLNIQISDTQESIGQTRDDVVDAKSQLAAILRLVYEEDQKPALVILLEGSLSDFFSNLVYLDGLNSKVSSLLDNTRSLKAYLEGQQEKMSDNVDQLQKTIALQSTQKSQNEVNKKTQETYLQMTEAQYQEQLANKTEIEKNKAKIQALLFSLAGTSDTEAPTFGRAIEIAKSVASMVSIRPAFLLAVISQESAIGRNVGQCMLTDPVTGGGKKISTGAAIMRVMKPTRDVPPFIRITTALGRDPYNTPVSCWIPAYVSGVPTGWGGAMGPAQFIGSTWALFEDKLKAILGRPADPWAIQDAFTASALYLADLGATAQTATAEKRAASRYYGGSSSYANSVYTRATCIQDFIDSGTMSDYCQRLIF